MTRRIEILNYQNGEKYSSGETGNFISYGLDYEIIDGEVGNFSTAIIEIDDGTVRNVYVERIKFLQQELSNEERDK